MPIRVQCSGCKTALAVKDHLAGKRVRCPKCQTPISVPATASAASPAPVARPALPTQPKAKAPAAPSLADREAEALAALRDEPPANGHGTNGASNGSNANGSTPASAPAAPIKFQCDFCEAEVSFDAELAGKRAQCPECRQLIKVPLPKEEKPKDWRTVERKGPSAAILNQPEKIENAWGTETKTQVSQKVLLEAGAIDRPKKPPVPLAVWIERIVKGGLLALVVTGIGAVVWNLGSRAAVKQEIEAAEKAVDPTLPPIVQGECHIALALKALRSPKQRDAAREHFLKALQKAPPASDVRDRIDRDCFLIRLARAEVALGGSEDDVLDRNRFDWNQEVFTEIERTVKKIDNAEAKAAAARLIAHDLTEKGQPQVGLSLVRSIAVVNFPAKGVHVALAAADPSRQHEAAQIAPPPQPGRTPADILARIGYSESLARQQKIKEAIDLAQAPGETGHKFQALMGVASASALGNSDGRAEALKSVCDAAGKLLDRDPRANIPTWCLLQHVKFTAIVDPASAKTLIPKLPNALRRRAHVEVVLVILEKNPPDAEAIPLIRELDAEGPGQAIAWLALAHARRQAGQSLSFTPEHAEEQKLLAVLEMGR